MTNTQTPTTYEYMICGGGSILVREGGFGTSIACQKAARAELKKNPGGDYATMRCQLDDASWSRVR